MCKYYIFMFAKEDYTFEILATSPRVSELMVLSCGMFVAN